MVHFSLRLLRSIGLVVASFYMVVFQVLPGEPPFDGTIFIAPDVITENDPTAYRSLADAGQGFRTMFDRRSDGWENLNAFLFTASFSDGDDIEVQVNPEFSDVDSARAQALKYATVIGRLPN